MRRLRENVEAIRSLSRRFISRLLPDRVALVVVIILTGALGSYFLMTSKAATPVASTEAEAGTANTNATKVGDTTASGSQAVKFTAPGGGGGGGNVCPAYPSFPDASCTGVPAGQTLAVVNGDQTYGTSSNGQTITDKDFHGFVTVSASNITFKNCIFRGGSTSGNAALLDTQEGSGTNIVVQDSEFTPSNQSAGIDGIWARSITLLRVNVHGTTDGIKASSNTTIQDSYIHDMQYNANDPNQGGTPTHNDGVQILDGTNIHITHTNIATAGTEPNSAVQITQDFGAVGTVGIDSNLVDYGGCTINVAQKPFNSLNGVSITNNRFGRHQGYSGCTVLIGTKVTLAGYSGNVWNDTGQTVPAPQQHD